MLRTIWGVKRVFFQNLIVVPRRKWGVLQLQRATSFELHQRFATGDNLEGSNCYEQVF